MKLKFSLLLAIFASTANAQEVRQLDSHEHGVGELNVAIDGNTLAMEIHAPGADIVGFEYVAESAEDLAAIDAAVAALARPLELFIIPAAAKCTVVAASAELEGDEEHENGHEEEHHEDDDHADEAGHTEFHAEYTLNCEKPDAISEITFAYFDAFENARELEVQIISSSGAQAFEVEREVPTLDLRGLF